MKTKIYFLPTVALVVWQDDTWCIDFCFLKFVFQIYFIDPYGYARFHDIPIGAKNELNKEFQKAKLRLEKGLPGDFGYILAILKGKDRVMYANIENAGALMKELAFDWEDPKTKVQIPSDILK